MASALFGLLAVVLIIGAGAYVAWQVRPSYVFCAALFLSPIAGSWPRLGIPSFIAPDRMLLLVAVAAVLLRSAGVRDRPQLQVSPVHWLMLVTGAFAVISALIAGTLFDKESFFKLVEAFGLAPFLVFFVAPVAFRTQRDRAVLLGTLVALGIYLGFTTLFETLHLNALVFPKYILDPGYGINPGQSRGPFVEPVANGYALYVCAVASAIAWWRWRERGRRNLSLLAAATVMLCLAGSFMCLERSVWLGAGVATVLASLAISSARRYVALVVVALAVAVGGSLAFIPGFATRVEQRKNDQATIWDRKNMNRAAVNMIEARPLLGFGWDEFLRHNTDYFQQASDYPLTNVSRLRIHSAVLTYGVELGLVGLTLWLATLVFGVGGALATRGPPDLAAWRIGLFAVAVCYMIITNFVPPYVFPNLSLWLWAGVCWSGRYAPAAAVGRQGAAEQGVI